MPIERRRRAPRPGAGEPGTGRQARGHPDALGRGADRQARREIAPCHRHSPSAIRFIIEGDRTYTNLNGDKCVMGRGDLVLDAQLGLARPRLRVGRAHDLDGRTRPAAGGRPGRHLLRDVPGPPLPHLPRQRVRAEVRRNAPPAPRGRSRRRTVHRCSTSSGSPPTTRCKRIGEGAASPHDDVCFEYLNPNTGGPVLTTMSCTIQKIRPGVRTRAHRQVQSSVYLAFCRQGATR